mmetsp:Transcript_39323/g.116519  ORF Transcript_39323/g.116519 Transcript_39323/m.116519 type:complete len:202 (-) Transcript_39323:1662-2267(-)
MPPPKGLGARFTGVLCCGDGVRAPRISSGGMMDRWPVNSPSSVTKLCCRPWSLSVVGELLRPLAGEGWRETSCISRSGDASRSSLSLSAFLATKVVSADMNRLRVASAALCRWPSASASRRVFLSLIIFWRSTSTCRPSISMLCCLISKSEKRRWASSHSRCHAFCFWNFPRAGSSFICSIICLTSSSPPISPSFIRSART